MRTIKFRVWMLSLIGAGLMTSPLQAQVVGHVATMEGTVEIGRTGAWAEAAPGAEVQQGDSIRTGRPGRVRVVFRDNSVLKISDGSEVAVTTQVFDGSKGSDSSILNLVRGKVRAIVSEYYKDSNARFEVRSTTAVAGVRGTDFVVSYDESVARTEVIGISGKVQVTGVTRPNQPAVVVAGRQITSVGRDGFVSPVQRASDDMFRQYLDGVDFVGQGAPESVSHQLTSGDSLPPADRVGLIAGGLVPSGGTSVVRAFAEDGLFPPNGPGLIDQPPSSVGLGEASVPF